jgi:hypothetical protein
MRKMIFCLLLAGAATPALAAGGPNHRDDDSTRDQARAERAERPAREQATPSSVQRPQFAPGQPRGDFQRPQSSGDWQRGRPAINPNAGQAPDEARNWQRRDGQAQPAGSWQQRQQSQYGANRYPQQQRYGGGYANSNNWRGGNQAWRRGNDRDSRVQWNRDWRNDGRYDWRERRYYDRSRFHLGLYIDPFGWGYQPYSIGYELRPNYYQQNYWIDPSLYGLPFPPPGAQWIRYWNDAVLVDMYSGRVIDSIPGFFW